jgi:ABC transport system ATP-binding/permease protein
LKGPAASSASSLLSAHNLHKSFGSHTVLQDATLTLSRGERVGLVGDNGSGKSTLARILAGVEVADQGTVMRQRGARISILTQVPQQDPDLSAFDTVALGLHEWQRAKSAYDQVLERLAESTNDEAQTAALLKQQAELMTSIEDLGGWEQEHKILSLLEHLCVPDSSVRWGSLSGGEQRRVALAQQLLAAPDLLILDEPTNHLDTQTIDWLELYLQDEFRGALLLITHDRYFLDRVATRTLELAAGQLTSYPGGWEQYLIGKAERELLAARTESNRQNFLRREVEWLRRQPKARGTKQKARVERALDTIDNAPAQKSSGVQLSLEAERQGSSILTFENVSLTIGERLLVSGLTLTLTKRQRIGIIGRNGMGKTTLLRAVTGDLKPTSGEVKHGKNTRLSYFDQTRSGLDESRSVVDNVTDAPRVRFAGQDLTIYSYMERFNFRSEELHKKVAMLSGGERARVALAKLLLQETNLLLFDEPTNDLDVSTLGSLEELLVGFEGSALIVTHDRYFLNRVATDILAFEGDAQVVHVVGNYDTYKALRPDAGKLNSAAGKSNASKSPASQSNAQSVAPQSPAIGAKPTPGAAPSPAGPRPVKLTYKEQRELEGLLQLIEQAESEAGRLQTELNAPDLYRKDAARAANLQAALNAARQTVDQRLARWEELEGKREAFERAR